MYLENDQNTSNDPKNGSTFRMAFKKFKNGFHYVDKDQIVDLDRPSTLADWVKFDCKGSGTNDFGTVDIHITEPSTWSAYKYAKKSGLMLIKNIFKNEGHYIWAKRCLKSYPLAPNKTNLAKDLDQCDFASFSKKLRWITMGYHHDWNTKQYSEHCRAPIPQEMQNLCTFVAQTVFNVQNFRAEAAIVNFYHKNSTLAGHVDQSERTYAPPLFSFSFGQSAIFMVGGTTLDDPDWPIAVKLKSGDLLIMYDELRLAYHAVPKIIIGEFECNVDDSGKDSEIVDYLNRNRININVRQVNGD